MDLGLFWNRGARCYPQVFSRNPYSHFVSLLWRMKLEKRRKMVNHEKVFKLLVVRISGTMNIFHGKKFSELLDRIWARPGIEKGGRITTLAARFICRGFFP